jgi:hypothetical protein
MDDDDNETPTTTIKVGLTKSLRLPTLHPVIEECVEYISHVTVRGSRIVNGFLVHATSTGQLENIDKKSTRELLVKQAFTLGLESARPKKKPFPGLHEWWEKNRQRYPVAPKPPRIPSKEITDYVAKTYATNLTTNLWKHHEGRLRKYLKCHFGSEAEAILHRIHRRSRRLYLVPTREQTECIETERTAFGLTDAWGEKHMIGERRLKNNATECLSRGAMYLRHIEDYNGSLGEGDPSHIKVWSLAPLSTRKRHFVTIDSEILMQMMISVDALPKQTLADFWPLAPAHFDSVFSVRRGGRSGPSRQLKTRCYVQTDGVVLAAQFEPAAAERIKGGKRAEKKEHKRKRDEAAASGSEPRVEKPFVPGVRKRADERRKICADPLTIHQCDDLEKFYCDPGRVNMIYMVRSRDSKVFCLTRKQYYQEAGINRSNEAWSKWNADLHPQYQALSAASPKTASVDGYNHFLEVDVTVSAAIWANNYARRASRMRFHTHIGKHRVLQGFLSRLGEGLGSDAEKRRRVLVGYGQAKFASHGKAGEMAVPVTDCFKQCAKMWSTCLVDENYTSAVCFDCDGRLVDVKTQKRRALKVSGGGVRVVKADNRAVHRCTNACKASGRSLKHREYNAAMNIGRVFEAMLAGGERPAALTRAGAPPLPGLSHMLD